MAETLVEVKQEHRLLITGHKQIQLSFLPNGIS